MDFQEPPSLQITDAPLKVPVNIHGFDQRMRRWLENRESNHTQPIDPGQVIIRPLTDEERAAREQRLRQRSEAATKPPVHYRRQKRVPPNMQPIQEASPEVPADPEPTPAPPLPTQPRRRRRYRRQAKAQDLGNTIRTWLGI